ncbi:MAG TPA: FAD-binding oxidoreductase [Gaiellaceae bacterium]|nr:FAD-binding oxidoreductase [Gaiellaceae bacterium]
MGRSEVAVVGAGITGLSVAWHLLQRGFTRVSVLEKTAVGAGASGVQPGGVRQQWATAVNCVLARESLAFYRQAAARLGARVELRFRPCGYLFVAHTRGALERMAAAVELQRSLGVPSRVVSPAEAAELVPGLHADAIVGGTFCPEDGYFDRPQAVVEAFADAVVRAGAELRIEEVVSLVRDSGWTLRLADGGETLADQVVVAAGYDSPPLLATTGVELPIEREARYLFLGDPLEERLLEPLVVAPERHFAAKQLADGRLLASDLHAAGDPETERETWREHVRASILELLPHLEFVPLPLLVEGLYDVTPDHQAIVGPVPERPGLWIAAGFSGHGFMVAPAVGRALASQLAGEAPDARLAQLAPDRFARGELVPESSVV